MKILSVSKAPIKKQMYDLKLNSASAIISGKYREAREFQKEYAKLAVKNFDIALHVPQPVRYTAPLFSKMGWNYVKFILFKFFTKKSPEEKEFKRMMEEYNFRKQNCE